MKKDCILLLENEYVIIKTFVALFEDLNIQAELIPCKTPKEYEEALEAKKGDNSLKAIIMDLSNTPEEEDSKEYKAVEFIQSEYDCNRIPIFVHSGNLDYYDQLENKGTVYKIHKGDQSIQEICEKIKKFEDSDFLNIFCIGGKLEEKIMSEIHTAFKEQFKGEEISKIIESIENSEPDDFKLRTNEVFQRIALRNVLNNWNSATLHGDGEIKEARLNSIEHYYHRISDFEFWTGDIFISKIDDLKCIILTPRCNVGHGNFDQLLLCRVDRINEQRLKELTGKKGEERLRKNITDHEIVGERYRFLPPSPQFAGGLVDFKTVFTLKDDSFRNNWEREITLSDELTNDVVRKFAAYNLRGGISETEFKEAHHYVKNLVED